MITKILRKRISLVIILFIILASFLPTISGTPEKNGLEFGVKKETLYQSDIAEWEQLIGGDNQGFGKNTNIGIRGIEVYNSELYLGTQSFNKSKMMEAPDLHNIITMDFLSIEGLFLDLSFNLREKTLLSFIFSRCLRYTNSYFLTLLLSRSLNLAMSARAKMSDGCEVWKYNQSNDSWSQLVGDNTEADLPIGFGDTRNLAASVIKEFKGKLYIGTWTSPLGGCELWRYDGNNWEQVVGKNALVKGGFNDSYNIAVWCMEEFNEYLYVGTMNWGYTDNGGCQVWRSKDGIHWSMVVDRGFRDFLPESEQNVHNTYAWSIITFKDQLYIGTFNTNSVFGFENSGCQLFRTLDGMNWEKVDCPGGDGFGEPENYGIRSMAVYHGELYVASATDAYQPNGPNVQGCEIWKYDGETWTEIIGDGKSNVTEKDGFGTKWNKYIWSIVATSDDKLWVGTLNMQIRVIGENTKGCEVWCFDGTNWAPVVKNELGEIDNGFGNIYNEGARVMKEYPPGSGNIVVGTFKVVKPPKISEGCEVWMRNV